MVRNQWAPRKFCFLLVCSLASRYLYVIVSAGWVMLVLVH